MDFRIKCLLQTIFSFVPRGEILNYFFQKYIARTFPPDNNYFLGKTAFAFLHYNNFLKYNKLEIRNGKYYEFGAGWTLEIPLSMGFLGFDVHCIDIRKLIVPELIMDTLAKFESNKDELPFRICPVKNENIKNVIITEQLKNNYRVNYIAPMDARNTSFEDNSFDFISSTSTLEHIPKEDILPILKECYRILNKGGVMSLIIDYKDHWSYFDKSISNFNFLRYSSKEWKKFNPSLHYQNRLRHSEYIDLISQTNFKVVNILTFGSNDNVNKAFKAMECAADFENYMFDDLIIGESRMVLLK